MLIEFSVANYKSIKDEAKLSLVASPAREHRDTHVISPDINGLRSISLLRSAAIFGPNASGKTNLIRALHTMQKIVSHSAGLQGDLPVIPFQFCLKSVNKPTTFEVVGIVNQVRFQYGFSVTQKHVTNEWLYTWPKGRPQRWFVRSTSKSDEVICKFGEKLSGDKEVWRRATRPNSLLLSTAVTLNSEQLKPIFHWFDTMLHIGGIGGWGKKYSTTWCKGKQKNKIVEFMRSADFAIDDLRVSNNSTSIDLLNSSNRPGEELYVKHQTQEGHTVELNLKEESDGTQKIFEFAAPWIHTLENGHVIVYDELHEHIHPVLLKFLINQFHDQKWNKQNAQLIFSTHDSSIMNQEILRRDQYWFCERNSKQETELFPLIDFSPRRRYENLARSYLGGRYGALPYPRFLQENVGIN